ncbi:MAG TPA: NAD-dependent epimerase/dehydratase family protein [Methylomirabilota bacterium]|nr:NAD-dependent epimerase/dehydratase family protein [Methylomirabilota bacterium]
MSAEALRSLTVLVTGGAGFIGSHLVDALVAGGARVRVLDDFSSGRREHLAGAAAAGAEIVEGDICDERALDATVPGCRVIMHLATRCVRLSLSDPEGVHRVNSEGTLRVLMAARRHHVERVVYVSSSEIYGTAVRAPMAEDHPLAPTTVYGATKLAGELYTQAMTRSFGLPTIVVRPFNTYGPRAHFAGVYGEVIPRFTVRLLNGRRPVIFGDGSQTRDFTYVTDTVRGILAAATMPDARGQVMNVARGEEVTIRRLAELLAKAIDPVLTPEFAEARPGDVHRHWADVSQARTRLGFRAEIGIEEGLGRYLRWFREVYPDPATCLRDEAVRNW